MGWSERRTKVPGLSSSRTSARCRQWGLLGLDWVWGAAGSEPVDPGNAIVTGMGGKATIV